MVSYRATHIMSYGIVSYRIVSYRVVSCLVGSCPNMPDVGNLFCQREAWPPWLHDTTARYGTVHVSSLFLLSCGLKGEGGSSHTVSRPQVTYAYALQRLRMSSCSFFQAGGYAVGTIAGQHLFSIAQQSFVHEVPPPPVFSSCSWGMIQSKCWHELMNMLYNCINETLTCVTLSVALSFSLSYSANLFVSVGLHCKAKDILGLQDYTDISILKTLNRSDG